MKPHPDILSKVTCPLHAPSGRKAKSLDLAVLTLNELIIAEACGTISLDVATITSAAREREPSITASRVGKILAGLVSEGFVVKTAHGKYAINDAADVSAAEYAATGWCERCRVQRYIIQRWYGVPTSLDPDPMPASAREIRDELDAGVMTREGAVDCLTGKRVSVAATRERRMKATAAFHERATPEELEWLQELGRRRGRNHHPLSVRNIVKMYTREHAGPWTRREISAVINARKTVPVEPISLQGEITKDTGLIALAFGIYGVAGREYAKEEIDAAQERRFNEINTYTSRHSVREALRSAATLNSRDDDGSSLGLQGYITLREQVKEETGSVWPSHMTIIRHYGTWNDAKRAAGLRVVGPGSVSLEGDEDAIAA
jgi:hypothetical protein